MAKDRFKFPSSGDYSFATFPSNAYLPYYERRKKEKEERDRDRFLGKIKAGMDVDLPSGMQIGGIHIPEEEQLGFLKAKKDFSVPDNFKFLDELPIAQRQLGVKTGEAITQAMYGYGNTAALGLPAALGVTMPEPESSTGQVARAIGSFAGFLKTPVKIGRVAAGYATKKFTGALAQKVNAIRNLKTAESVANASSLIRKAQMVKRGFKYGAGGALMLGTAEVAADIAHPKQYLNNFAHGAKIGTIFGAMGMAHIVKYPALSMVARQAGGRALMAVANEYPEGFASKENLGQLVYSEALNTFFLWKGVTPDMILKGKIPKKHKKIYDKITEQTEAHNREIINKFKMSEPTIKLGKDVTWDKVTAKMHLRDIWYEPDTLRENEVKGFEDTLKAVDISKKGLSVSVEWDSKRQRYITKTSGQLLEALKRKNAIEIKEGRKPTLELNVTIDKLKPEQANILPTPLEVASLFGDNSITWETIDKISSTQYFLYDVKKKTMRPVFPEEADFSPKKGKERFNPDEIQFEIEKRGGAKEIIATGAGKNVRNLVKQSPDTLIRRETQLHERIKELDTEINRESTRSYERDEYIKERDKINAELKRMKRPADKKVTPAKQIKNLLKKKATFLSQKRAYMDGIKDVKNFIRLITAEQKLEKQKVTDRNSKQGIRYLKGQKVLLENQVTLSRAEYQLDKLKVELKKVTTRLRNLKKVEKGKKPESTVFADAKRMINDIYKTPKRTLPIETSELLRARYGKLGMAVDYDTFLKMVIEHPGDTTLADLYTIEHNFNALEHMGRGERLRHLMGKTIIRWGLHEKDPSGDFAEKQRKEDAYYARKREKTWDNARDYVRKQKGRYYSPLAYILRPKAPIILENIRQWAGRVERKTGIPFHPVVRRILAGSAKRGHHLTRLTGALGEFAEANNELQNAVRVHYSNLYLGKNVYPERYSPELTKYIETIDTIMKEMAPVVRRYRHLMWIQDVEFGHKNVKVYRNQDNPEVRNLLLRGMEAKAQADIEGKPEVYEAWLEGEGKSVGIIREGAYLPEFMIRGKDVPLSKQEMMRHINVMGTTHLQSRKVFDGKDIAEIGLAESDIMSPNLNKQIYGYVNQVLNVQYLKDAFDAFDAITSKISKHLDAAKPKAGGKGSPESKALSTGMYLKIFADRAKGYPIQGGLISQYLKKTQSMFFRALTVRPYLWLRNLFQPIVTVPHKEIMFDPRFTTLNENFKWEKIPEAIREKYVEEGVDQRDSFNHSFLALEATAGVKKVPVLGWIFKAAEKVGGIYSFTDSINRRRVFRRTFHRSKYYMQEYNKGNINAKTMEQRLGIDKVDPNERKIIRNLITDKNLDDASFEMGRWMTDNSQWKYSRVEKGLWEQTAEGETWSNLLTWTKGIVHSMVTATERITEGIGTKNPAMVRGGAATIGGYFLAGTVANEILQAISVSHGSKYKNYGADAFMWSFGGVTAEIVRDFTDNIAGLVTAFDGTKEEQKTALNNALSMVDNIGIRQLTPFAKQALSLVEAMTNRSYISPVRDALTHATSGYGKDAKYVERTNLEAVAHAILSRDPNKTATVRRETYRKLQEMRRKLATSNNPIFRTYLKARIEKYTYMNDLFQRYTPYRIWETEQRKEREERNKRISMESTSYGYKQELEAYRRRRQ